MSQYERFQEERNEKKRRVAHTKGYTKKVALDVPRWRAFRQAARNRKRYQASAEGIAQIESWKKTKEINHA